MNQAIQSTLLSKTNLHDAPLVQIQNDHATATISLLGGQILNYQPHGTEPLLWLSEHNPYQISDLTRGGIPICWPWLGLNPVDKTEPLHGVVRRSLWEIVAQKQVSDGATEVTLAIHDSEESRAHWNHSFELTLTITIGASLQLVLTAHNRGTTSFTMGGAFHTYLHVADVRKIMIEGVEGATYWDAARDIVTQQNEPLVIEEEVDRVYQFSAETILHDPIFQRKILVSKQNSATTVIWNPSQTTKHSYIAADDYQHFVCIETAKYGDDCVLLQPNESFSFGTTIRCLT